MLYGSSYSYMDVGIARGEELRNDLIIPQFSHIAPLSPPHLLTRIDKDTPDEQYCQEVKVDMRRLNVPSMRVRRDARTVSLLQSLDIANTASALQHDYEQ